MEGLAGRNAVDQLDAADLDQPMALIRDRGRWFRYRARSRALASICLPDQRARINLPPLRHLSNRRAGSSLHLRAGGVESLRAIHDEIRAAALFGVGHLPRQHRLELVLRSCPAAPARARAAPRPAPRPPPPHRRARRRRSRTAAECRAPRPCAPALSASGKKRALGLPHQRMHDRFQPLQRRPDRRARARPSLARSTLPSAVVPGNAASIAGTASPS